jgi:hypothetical protein
VATPLVSYVSGHSSGGHLAGVILTADWRELDLPADVVKGGLCSSGMYDLEPRAPVGPEQLRQVHR